MTDRWRAALIVVVLLAGMAVVVALLWVWLLGEGSPAEPQGEGAAVSTTEAKVVRKAPPAPRASQQPPRASQSPPPSPPPSPGDPEQLAAFQRFRSYMEVASVLQRNAEEAPRTVEQYCERTRALKQRPGSSGLPRRQGGSADAGPFLAPLIDWYVGPDQQMLRGPLHLPEALSSRIAEARGSWPEVLSRADTAGLDFRWMRQAMAYDHWSLASAGPIADGQGQANLAWVLPDYILLRNWSKLRYADALWRGDVGSAGEEVQHLGMLVLSNGTVLGDDIGALILGLATPVSQVAAARGIPLAGLPLVDPSTIKEVRALGREGLRYFWPGVPAEVTARALSCSPSPCTHVADGVFLRRLLGPFSPAESEGELWDLVAAGDGCDGALLELMTESNPMGSAEAVELVHVIAH